MADTGYPTSGLAAQGGALPAGLDLEAEINRLRRARNAVILAHYYQDGDIQDIADFVGDSLDLSRKAAATDADVIVFCGVRFMAEVAKILSPDKTVILPDMAAGCSLEESCPPAEFKAFREAHPDHIAITYINCSAEVKALSDVIVTSSNAEAIVRQIPEDQPIIFAPDRHLGAYIARKTGRDMLLWEGTCVVHEQFSEREIVKLRTRHPEAKVVAHPECPEAILAHADNVASTSGMLRYVDQSNADTFIVATEPGLIHQMKKAHPEKTFITAPGADGTCSCATCPFMALNTMEKLHHALETLSPVIELNETLRQRALAQGFVQFDHRTEGFERVVEFFHRVESHEGTGRAGARAIRPGRGDEGLFRMSLFHLVNESGLGRDDKCICVRLVNIAQHARSGGDVVGMRQDRLRAFGMGHDLGLGVAGAQLHDFALGELLVHHAGAFPKQHIAPGLARDIGAQMTVGREDDRLVFGNLAHDGFGVGGRDDNIGERLHLGRAVDIGDRNVIRVSFAKGLELGRRAGFFERAAGRHIGQDHGFVRAQNLRHLGHETDAAKDDHIRIRSRRLARQIEAVADEIGNVLNIPVLIVMREDDRVARAAQTIDLGLKIQSGRQRATLRRKTAGRIARVSHLALRVLGASGGPVRDDTVTGRGCQPGSYMW